MNTEEFLNKESNLSKIKTKQAKKMEFLTPIDYFFVLNCYYSLKEKSDKE